MLKFIAAKEVENQEKVVLKRVGTALTGGELGMLTMMVIDRFVKQTDWESITEIYLAGLVGDDDLALIKRAVRALMDQGLSYGE